MSAPIDSNAGWAAYEDFADELPAASRVDTALVILSSLGMVGMIMLIVLAYIPGAAS